MTISEDVPPPPPATILDHPAHHQGHKLNRVENDGRFFICDGCMEPGVGTRYRCEHERCNFDLHTCCAVASDTLTHPVFGEDRVFLFLLVSLPATTTTTTGGQGKGTHSSRFCVACGEDVRGFVYHFFGDDDGGDGIDLHPCCAVLPEHAILRDYQVVCAAQQELPRPRDVSSNDDKRSSGETHVAAAARHRRWVGMGRGKPGGRGSPPEKTQHEEGSRVSVLRQEAQRPSDTSRDGKRGGREHRPPAACHRCWKY